MLLSVIIPCYNEELVVHETYERLSEIVKKTENVLTSVEEVIEFYSEHYFDLILVNDEVIDKADVEIILALLEKNGTFIGEKWTRNFNQQSMQ